MLSTTRRLLGHFRRFWITPNSIWLRQQREWVELRRDQIAALKFETVSRVIVRYYDGQRLIVSLYGFPNRSFGAVCRSLRDALRQNDETRGLWDGAKVLEVYTSPESDGESPGDASWFLSNASLVSLILAFAALGVMPVGIAQHQLHAADTGSTALLAVGGFCWLLGTAIAVASIVIGLPWSREWAGYALVLNCATALAAFAVW